MIRRTTWWTPICCAPGVRDWRSSGRCFCCKFNDLVATAATLVARTAPDIVITEPVGSCTDLMATVIEPLRHLHGDEYDVAPLAVLVKPELLLEPERGRKVLCGEASETFSANAAYIFLKQIEEADIIALNKVDKISASTRAEILQLVRRAVSRQASSRSKCEARRRLCAVHRRNRHSAGVAGIVHGGRLRPVCRW